VPGAGNRLTPPRPHLSSRLIPSPAGTADRCHTGQVLRLNRTMLSDHESPYVGRFACDWHRLATTDPRAAHRYESTRPPSHRGRPGGGVTGAPLRRPPGAPRRGSPGVPAGGASQEAAGKLRMASEALDVLRVQRHQRAVGGQSASAAYPFMAPLPAPIHKKTTRSPSLTRPARRSSSSRIRVLAADVLP